MPISIINVATFLLFNFLKKYLARTYDARIVRSTIVLITFSPVNIYLTTGYTESAFLCFSILVIYFLEKKTILGNFFGGITAISRGTGLLFLPLYAYRNIKRKKSWLSNTIPLSILLLLPLVSFSIYLHFQTGDFLAFYHVTTLSHSGIHSYIDWPYRLFPQEDQRIYWMH